MTACETAQFYHLIGVAGVGMNPLAQLLLTENCRISGSDRFRDQGLELPVLRLLQQQGLRLYPQDGSGISAATSAVVVSSAIENDNPELAAARRFKIPILHRTDLLAQRAAPHTLIGVAGTAGKTTTTGMLGWTLECLDADPTLINGGALVNWRARDHIGNFRYGHSGLWVMELDESDRSLLKFKPERAIITNISKDHFDLEESRELFKTFAAQVKHPVIGCRPGAQMPEFPSEFRPRTMPAGSSFKYRGVEFQLQVPGRHNAANALLCVMLCESLGYPLSRISTALAKFRGMERRLEHVGSINGLKIFDDYAHNPAKISAAWESLAPWHRRVVAVWRPHGYGPLRMMWEELIATFTHLVSPDTPLFLLPVFFSGGSADRRIGSAELAAALQKAGRPARAVADFKDLAKHLRATLQPGDALLLMGARDPGLPEFARDLLVDFRDLFPHSMPGAAGINHEKQAADQAPDQ